eukprot:jgi/Chlat1/398/Chrsp10S01507
MGKSGGRGRGKKGPTGRKRFSTREEIAGEGSKKRDPDAEGESDEDEEDDEEEGSSDEGEQADDADLKKKGVAGVVEVANPNYAGSKAVKATEADVEQDTPELSRREREELEKQRAKERYWKLHLAGKTDEAKKDLERLAVIKAQREEAARKRQEEIAAKEAKKVEGRKR